MTKKVIKRKKPNLSRSRTTERSTQTRKRRKLIKMCIAMNIGK